MATPSRSTPLSPAPAPQPGPPDRPAGSCCSRGVLLVVLLVGGIWLRQRVKASLPVGQRAGCHPDPQRPRVGGARRPGSADPQGRDPLDAARALGFVHAQDRFFQMDLLRREAAGEVLRVLRVVRAAARPEPPQARLPRLADQVLAAMTPPQRALLDAYAEGVNAGLKALGDKPFELHPAARRAAAVDGAGQHPRHLCHVLRPARLEDARRDGSRRGARPRAGEDVRFSGTRSAPSGTRRSSVPPSRRRRFPDPTSSTCASLTRRRSPRSTIPRWSRPCRAGKVGRAAATSTPRPAATPGPSPARTRRTGHALVANDMHFGITVPNIWYRASWTWRDPDGSDRRVTGVTLAGTPLLVAGSTGRIAWGFTNSFVDAVDLINLELDPRDPDVYRTPARAAPFRSLDRDHQGQGAGRREVRRVADDLGTGRRARREEPAAARPVLDRGLPGGHQLQHLRPRVRQVDRRGDRDRAL